MVLVNEKIASYYFPVDSLLSLVLGVPLHLRVNGKQSAQESNKICSGNNDLLEFIIGGIRNKERPHQNQWVLTRSLIMRD